MASSSHQYVPLNDNSINVHAQRDSKEMPLDPERLFAEGFCLGLESLVNDLKMERNALYAIRAGFFNPILANMRRLTIHPKTFAVSGDTSTLKPLENLFVEIEKQKQAFIKTYKTTLANDVFSAIEKTFDEYTKRCVNSIKASQPGLFRKIQDEREAIEAIHKMAYKSQWKVGTLIACCACWSPFEYLLTCCHGCRNDHYNSLITMNGKTSIWAPCNSIDNLKDVWRKENQTIADHPISPLQQVMR